MIKAVVTIYGVLSYLIYLMASLYLLGFLGNFLVPKSISSAAELPMFQAIVMNIALLGLFALQHSVMARESFKNLLTSYMNPAIERSTYVLMSSLVLLLLYWLWQPIPIVLWEINGQTGYWVIMIIYGLGWTLVLAATFMINHFELTGLQQVYDYLKNRQRDSSLFQVSYLYKFVRHPLMLGFLIVFWATPYMTVGHLLFTSVMTIYILLSVKYLEEKDLRKNIGKQYEEYQEEVPMIIPFTKRK